MTDIEERIDRMTRPIIGIENRTAQEAFAIMAERIRSGLSASPLLVAGGGSGSLRPSDCVPGRENDALSADILAALEADAAALLQASNNPDEQPSERRRYAHLYGGLTRAIRIAKEVIAK